MSRIRSPGYPAIPLPEAIEIVDKIFSKVRNNPIDRDAAVKDMGYKGMTGQSAKMLASLIHYNLVEKAGSGGIRVTDMAARILHPKNPEEKAEALNEAAYSPALFSEFKANWPDGYVSENALRAHLMRNGFSSVAIHPIIRSYMETYGFLQQHKVSESYSHEDQSDSNSPDRAESANRSLPALRHEGAISAQALVPGGVKIMAGERVVFVEESGHEQYLKLVAAGPMDETLLEALEDYIRRQKKRLQTPPTV
ncbi:MAG: hypothetical protein K8R18_04210 [Parvibaculum sp.]|uniref:hypothetical protein n=1 Tax=Parvibaculum sp. TaxID=2024848 RepID=UPI0025F113DC|nr:hypothetical protein [Parvibaculum sp.]MCE9648811.1 hypothetical protein [Parvibaculum sp.]